MEMMFQHKITRLTKNCLRQKNEKNTTTVSEV